ncbi:MAG: molybdopterin-dependent oxidoreductase [Planctomycetaceae bacterium]|nr:molybdopterin-dependent oxidoreductase [Planctomycetaceae bacterium]
MSLYRPATDPKYQTGDPPQAAVVPPDTIVSPDTLRPNRLPDGQHRTRKWPVLHATSVPAIDVATWSLTIDGLVERTLNITLPEFQALPRCRVFADFHCVTTWSRLGNLWEGVSVRTLVEQCGIRPESQFVEVFACDSGWTTNLPLAHLLQDDVLLADTHDGLALDADHGGPVRLIVPQLFAWKSAKWVHRITLTAENRPGHWERAGYHDVGDPWKGERRR